MQTIVKKITLFELDLFSLPIEVLEWMSVEIFR